MLTINNSSKTKTTSEKKSRFWKKPKRSSSHHRDEDDSDVTRRSKNRKFFLTSFRSGHMKSRTSSKHSHANTTVPAITPTKKSQTREDTNGGTTQLTPHINPVCAQGNYALDSYSRNSPADSVTTCSSSEASTKSPSFVESKRNKRHFAAVPSEESHREGHREMEENKTESPPAEENNEGNSSSMAIDDESSFAKRFFCSLARDSVCALAACDWEEDEGGPRHSCEWENEDDFFRYYYDEVGICVIDDFECSPNLATRSGEDQRSSF